MPARGPVCAILPVLLRCNQRRGSTGEYKAAACPPSRSSRSDPDKQTMASTHDLVSAQVSLDNSTTTLSPSRASPSCKPSSMWTLYQHQQPQRSSNRTQRKRPKPLKLSCLHIQDSTILPLAPITLTAVSSSENPAGQHYTFQFFLDCRP